MNIVQVRAILDIQRAANPPSRDSAFYSALLHCFNCGYADIGDNIPRGQQVPQRAQCPECKCFTLNGVA
jgi:hypothetical protein